MLSSPQLPGTAAPGDPTPLASEDAGNRVHITARPIIKNKTIHLWSAHAVGL